MCFLSSVRTSPRFPEDAHVAFLAGQAPDGTPKEVVVLRAPVAAVHVYNLESCGRRWFRSLVFSSRAERALRELPASLLPHSIPPGFRSGRADLPALSGTSVVVTRSLRWVGSRPDGGFVSPLRSEGRQDSGKPVGGCGQT